jgi:hypothetical protein
MLRLIRDLSWGAPKIHGELLKLGFMVSERSVSRYLRAVKRRGDPGKRWLVFLRNHREVIVALDFFTVPTVSFRVLYCLFVIEHARRRILHFHVTAHPNSDWVVQQLREAFPDSTPYRYVILDRDTRFDAEVFERDALNWPKAQAHEPRIALAKRSGGTMGRKLPPGIAGLCDSAERTAPATVDSGLRSLLPFGSHPRWARQGHPLSAFH